MDWIINFVAVLVCITSLLVTLGYDGYLLGFDKAARARAGSDAIRADVRKRLPSAMIATGVALVGLILTISGPLADIIGALLAVASASYSMAKFRATKNHYS